MATNFHNLPGVYDGRRYDPINIFVDPSRVEYAPTLAVIDGSLSRDTGNYTTSVLRAGIFFGTVTATKLLRPSIIGLTNAAITAGTVTSITVLAPVAAEVNRLIAQAGASISLKIVGPPAAGGTVATTTVTATAATGTTITITSATLPAYVNFALISPADGAETPVTFQVKQTGVDVVNINQASINQPLDLSVRKADILTSALPFYASLDVSLKKYLKNALKAVGSFTFDDDRPL